MKKYIFIIICMLMVLTGHAASYTTVTIDNIVYRLYGETMEAHVYHDKSSTSLTVTDNRLELPEKVTNESKEYKVTEIEYFSCNNTALTLVTPKTMTKVASVKKGVKTLVLGVGVTSVSGLEESANLEGFEVAEGNTYFSVDDRGVLYNKDKTKLRYAPYAKRSSFSSYVVASTVTYIGTYAFYGFNQLGSVTLPDGLKEISNYAFYDCNVLTACPLPSTVEKIGDYAFYKCPLVGFSLPAQLRAIGSYAFASNSANNYRVQGGHIQALHVPQYVESIGDYAFSNVTIDSVYAHCEPFNLTQKSPFGSPTNQVLVVPKGTRDIFSTYKYWNKIDNVIEGDFNPTFDTSKYPVGSSSLDSDGQTIQQAGVTYKLYNSGVARVYCNSNYTPETGVNSLKIPESIYYRALNYTLDGVEYFNASRVIDLLLPNTVTFVNNVKSGVKILKLPKSVTSVSGLSESANLEGFEVAEGNTYFSVDDRGVLYNKDKTKLRYAPYAKRSSFSSYVVASTVTYIGTYAFYGFNQLVKVTLPDGLKEIGNNAFYDCNALTACSLPSTIEQIGAYAFYKCPLAGFSLPAQLRTIGSYAFASSGNNNYRIQGGHIQALHVPQYVESIGDYAFRYVTIDSVYAHCEPFNLTQTSPFGSPSNQTLVVPKGTRDIFSTYKYWNKIDNVIEGDFNPTFDTSKYPVGSSSLDSDGQTIMQAGVTYKLYNSGVARVYCNSNYTPATGVNSLTIPESIYYRALNYTLDGVEYFNASRIIDLLLPNTVTFVNNVKSGVKILKLPKSVTSVSGLSGSANLEGFEVAEGNTYFSVDDRGVLYNKDKTKLRYAPYGKRSSFSSYVVASTVTYIGTNAFYGFNQLVKVTFPDGLKEIGNNAFYDCNALTTCSLPSTIEQIGAYAFYKCPLAGFSLPAQLRTIGSYAFASSGNNNYRIQGGHIQALHVPQYVESIGDYAFRYVTIDSVYSHIMSPLPISNNAFYNQSKVKLVVPTGTMEEYKLMGGWKLMTDITESEELLPKICITPKFTRKGNTLTLETSTTGASIYYTMDGKEPTVNSTLYNADSPIAPTVNCTIKAIAIKEGFDNSSVATYVVDWYKVEKPTFELNGTKLTIKTATEGASIYYTLGADAVPSATMGTLYTLPIELTDNRVVKAIGVKVGYEDSDIAEYSHGSVACPTPVFEKYDGRYFTIKPIDGAEIRFTMDGSTPTKTSALYDGRTAVLGLCTIKAMAFSDVKNPSDVASFKVTYFYSGEQAELTEAGTLEKTFEWCGTQGMTELEVNGPLNAADLTFIKEKLSTLQFLNLENATLADHQLPTEAFAGMQLVSFTSSKDINSVGDRIFANCQQLAAVVWNSPETMPANSFGDKLNPNMLVYVTNKLFAPSGVQNVVADRRASSIVLSDLEEGNGNFYCPVSFTAEKISYTHVYSQKTEIGKCMGWETIALPFKVQKFMHESKGEVIPYKQFEAEGSSEVAKPFWLRALTATGFEDAATIEANIPYIISMPSSQEYAARYNIDGKITFSSENIVVPVTNTTPVNKGDVYFVPTFLRVAKSKDVWAINKNEIYEGEAEGSAFVQNLRDARPFEAYVTTKAVANMPMLLSIADMGGGNNGTTGISMMLSDKADLDGTWYSLDGRKLQGKPTIKGVYVNNGKKIVVR